jgi:trehalose 6-phosphate phosphatase
VAGVPESLAPLCDRPRSAAIFLDFDGTLAPIVADPAEARPLAGAQETLVEVAATFGLVAVVSGRPATFLREVVGPAAGVRLEGLYGLEEVVAGGEIRVAPDVEPWRPVVAQVAAAAASLAPPGVGVEPKGLSVTLHWRGHPAGEVWARRFADDEIARTGLVAQAGRMALELRPPVAVDKGSVVLRLGRGFAAAAYFGDDLGDLPAFAALGVLASEGAHVARVAVTDPESPPEVGEAADVVVEGPEQALDLLRRLVAGAS